MRACIIIFNQGLLSDIIAVIIIIIGQGVVTSPDLVSQVALHVFNLSFVVVLIISLVINDPHHHHVVIVVNHHWRHLMQLIAATVSHLLLGGKDVRIRVAVLWRTRLNFCVRPIQLLKTGSHAEAVLEGGLHHSVPLVHAAHPLSSDVIHRHFVLRIVNDFKAAGDIWVTNIDIVMWIGSNSRERSHAPLLKVRHLFRDLLGNKSILLPIILWMRILTVPSRAKFRLIYVSGGRLQATRLKLAWI